MSNPRGIALQRQRRGIFVPNQNKIFSPVGPASPGKPASRHGSSTEHEFVLDWLSSTSSRPCPVPTTNRCHHRRRAACCL